MNKTINTFADLCEHFDADESFGSLTRRIYKDTACGASVSLYGTLNGAPHAVHNGQTMPDGFVPDAFTIQTIVEGSDAVVDGPHMAFGRVTTDEVDAWVRLMEATARELWEEANESGKDEE